MERKWLGLASRLLMVILIISTCGGAEGPGEAPTEESEAPVGEGEQVTLRVLVHQNPPMVAFMEAFNAKFEDKYPKVTVDMSVVNTNDLSTVTQARLNANDVDVVGMFGFSNVVQPYMKDVTPPDWQTLIDAGLILDISDQLFVKNYDVAAIADAGTYNGKVYQVNLGRVSYSGIYYNKDLFAAHGVGVPTTWSELVAACETFSAAGIPCMTAGGKDGWPISMGAYGLIGSIYPDQAALVEGLWTGTIRWNDTTALDMWEKMKVYAQDMLEPGAIDMASDAVPGRFASGVVAMFPGGTWCAPAIESAEPDFEWGYIPFPGSDDANDNQYLFGKYDQGWVIAARTPNRDAALTYLTEFSDPANYQEFAHAVGFIPTQPGATLDTQIGGQVAPYLESFCVGYEQTWVAPAGAGPYANPFAAYFKPFGTYDSPQELADKVQADLQSGLDACGLAAQPSGTPIPDVPGWDLVWHDEFDGTAIDDANWGFDIGAGGWGNEEVQFYTSRPENARVEDGMLVIEARQEEVEGSAYTSARLKTQGLQSFQYGWIEARLKVPSGVGLWPAFWMLGATFDGVNWPDCGEIDIMEYIGREPNVIMGTLHGPGYSGAQGITQWHRQDYAIADDFHIYAVEWQPGQIVWTYDGEPYHTVAAEDLGGGPWVFDRPFFILLNLAMGGQFAGLVSLDTVFPAQYLVDYVRVYQHDGL